MNPHDPSAHREPSVPPGHASPLPPTLLDFYCPECDYNLRGLTSDRCPECGQSIDFLKLSESQIPWVRRAELGRCRAYYRTIRWVMFRRKRFAHEIARPAGFSDSQKFRWITILIAYATTLATAAAWYGFHADEFTLRRDDGSFSDAVWIALVYSVLVFPLLICLTGLPSYFFHPRGLPVQLQNRALALSYYAAAPLACAPLVPLLYVASRFALPLSEPLGNILLGLAIWLPLAFAVKWWLDLVFLARRTLHPTGPTMLRLYLLLPFLWLLTAASILLVLPAMLLYVAAFFVTLYG